MNYKLITQSSYWTEDILDVVCRNRGIEDINKIKSPSVNDVIHYSKLNHIDKFINAILHFAKRESTEVGIIVDSDP